LFTHKWLTLASLVYSADVLCSYLWRFDSYARIKANQAVNGNLPRMYREVPDSHSSISATVLHLPLGFDDRVVSLWQCWEKRPDGSIIIAFAPMKEFSGDESIVNDVTIMLMRDPQSARATRSSMRGFWEITPLAAAVCSVKLVIQGTLGGSIPDWVETRRVYTELFFVRTLQDKFVRNGRHVDREIRGNFAPPPRRHDLEPAQNFVVSSATNLELYDTDGDGHWTALRSKSPFITMQTRYTTTGTAKLAIGKATSTVDTSALQAAAWYFSFCSRERQMISKQEKNPVRIVVEKHTEHDWTVATIKSMPFPIANREFLLRQVCCFDDGPAQNPDILVAIQSPSDPSLKIDYGQTFRAVRATTQILLRLSPTTPTSCTATVIMYTNLGGNVPVSMIAAKLPQILDVVDNIRVEFQRDDESDRNERLERAAVIGSDEQSYEAEEISLFKTAHARIEKVHPNSFEEFISPDHFVFMSTSVANELKSACGRAVTLVDANITECAAWAMNLMDREHLKAHVQFGANKERSLTTVNEHHFIFRAVVDLKVPGLRLRQFISKILWKWEDDDTLIVIGEDCEDAESNNPNYVRASLSSFTKYQRLSPIGSIEQTRVTFTQFVHNLGGSFPHYVVSRQRVELLMRISRMRRKFDNSLSRDKEKMEKTVLTINSQPHDAHYTDEENEVIRQGLASIESFADASTKKIKVKSGSPTIDYVIMFKKGTRVGWGKSEVLVRASKEQVLAYMWNAGAQCRWSRSDIERSVLKVVNDHHEVVLQCKKGSKGFGSLVLPREGITRAVWKELEDETLLFASVSCQRPGEEEKTGARGRRTGSIKRGSATNQIPTRSSRATAHGIRIRAKMPVTLLIKEIQPGLSSVVYVNHLDMGGSLPSIVMNAYLKMSLSVTHRLQNFYQEQRELCRYDREDGKAIGVRLMHPGGKKRRTDMVDDVVEKHNGLKELSLEYPWLKVFLRETVRGRLQLNRSVGTKLECLSITEAKRIGQSLSPALRQRKTAEAGLYQWKMQNPAMVELFEKHEWSESMMLTISQEVLTIAPWGMVWRVLTGAGLNIIDTASDINVIILYLRIPEKTGFGWALLTMILGSVFLQLCAVWAQNKKKPWHLLRESLFVISLMKPGVDAFRVVTGAEMAPWHTFDAKTELSITKGIELFAESIPGCIIQLYAFLGLLKDNQEGQNAALWSIIISTATAGFTSAIIAYDHDTNPEKRTRSPKHFGYVPDAASKRSLMLLCLCIQSSVLLLIRSISAVLLLMVGPLYLAVFVLGEMGLYLFIKVLRGDWHYWVPVYGVEGFLITLVARVGVKFVTDFTGLMQSRVPSELGGAYWSFNMFAAIAVSFGSVAIHYDRMSVADAAIEEKTAWLVLGLLSTVSVVTFAVFLLLMKKGYRRTFFSTETSKQFTIDNFVSAVDDAGRAEILKRNKYLWMDIREDVGGWIKDNWFRWGDERPAWFSAHFKVLVPLEMIPSDHPEKEEVRRRGKRASISESMRRLRESLTDDGGMNELEERENIKLDFSRKRGVRSKEMLLGDIAGDVCADL